MHRVWRFFHHVIDVSNASHVAVSRFVHVWSHLVHATEWQGPMLQYQLLRTRRQHPCLFANHEIQVQLSERVCAGRWVARPRLPLSVQEIAEDTL